jgi:prevent-host-death family protein
MKRISMVEFRLNSQKIIAQVQKGQRMILTRRGKPVARLEPFLQEITGDDPFYSLTSLSDSWGGSLSNEQIDGILSEQRQEKHGQRHHDEPEPLGCILHPNFSRHWRVRSSK